MQQTTFEYVQDGTEKLYSQFNDYWYPPQPQDPQNSQGHPQTHNNNANYGNQYGNQHWNSNANENYGQPQGQGYSQSGYYNGNAASEQVQRPQNAKVREIHDKYRKNTGYQHNGSNSSHSKRRLPGSKSSSGKNIASTRKCMYGCIPIKKRPRYICLGTTTAILALLIALIVMFTPHTPGFKVMSLSLANGLQSFRINGLQNGITRAFSVEMDMVMVISVLNSNRYEIKIEDINLNAYILANITQINLPPGAAALIPGTNPRRIFTNADSQVLIGTGRHDALNFPASKNISFNMNFTVLYTPSQTVELKDDVLLNEFLQSCNIIGTGNRTMVVMYNAETPITILKPFYTPVFSDSLKINCPFRADQLDALVLQLRGQTSNSSKVGSAGGGGVSTNMQTPNGDMQTVLQGVVPVVSAKAVPSSAVQTVSVSPRPNSGQSRAALAPGKGNPASL